MHHWLPPRFAILTSITMPKTTLKAFTAYGKRMRGMHSRELHTRAASYEGPYIVRTHNPSPGSYYELLDKSRGGCFSDCKVSNTSGCCSSGSGKLILRVSASSLYFCSLISFCLSWFCLASMNLCVLWNSLGFQLSKSKVPKHVHEALLMCHDWRGFCSDEDVLEIKNNDRTEEDPTLETCWQHAQGTKNHSHVHKSAHCTSHLTHYNLKKQPPYLIHICKRAP